MKHADIYTNLHIITIIYTKNPVMKKFYLLKLGKFAKTKFAHTNTLFKRNSRHKAGRNTSM